MEKTRMLDYSLSMNDEKLRLHPIHTLRLSLKRSCFYLLLLSCLINLLMLTVPLYMLQLYERVIPGHSMDTLLYLTVIALFALVILTALDIIRAYISISVGEYIERRLSPLALSLSADEVLQGKNYHVESLSDISRIRQFLSGGSFFTFLDMPWIPIYLFVIYLLHISLGVLATIGALLLFMLALFNDSMTRKLSIKANKETQNLSINTKTTVNNAESIQAMGMIDGILDRWTRVNEHALGLQTNVSERQSLILSCSKGIRMSLQVLVLGVGAYYVLQNQMTAGMMIVASIIMSRALAPIEQALSSWRQMQRCRESYQRLNSYFSLIEMSEKKLELPIPKGNIDLQSVYFIPPGSKKPTLLDINLNIKAGESVAIIGGCSSGKTTLAKLLVGAWAANSGSVRMDGANIYEWDRAHFGKYTGYMPQDSLLFHARVKDNIARMGEVSDEKVIRAAKQAGAHQFILKLPKGYDTIIGPGAHAVSAGQKQMLSFACALYNDPVFIMLDEPNSHLDSNSESILIDALKDLKSRNSTIVFITHRPSLLDLVDTVVILKEGKIQIAGPKEQVYKQLQSIQGNKKKEDGDSKS